MKPATHILLGALLLTSCNVFLQDEGQLDMPCETTSDCSGDLYCAGTTCQYRPERLWQLSPSLDTMSYAAAKDHCQDLVFEGHDNWRLPTIDELRTLVAFCPDMEAGGPCGVSEDCNRDLPPPEDSCMEDCIPCDPTERPEWNCYWLAEMKGVCQQYWSSTPVENIPANHWVIDFQEAAIGAQSDNNPHYVRCIREHL